MEAEMIVDAKDAKDLEDADRKTLQALAKKHNIKANQKSSVLRMELENLFAAASGKKSPQTSPESTTSHSSPTNSDNSIENETVTETPLGSVSKTRKKLFPPSPAQRSKNGFSNETRASSSTMDFDLSKYRDTLEEDSDDDSISNGPDSPMPVQIVEERYADPVTEPPSRLVVLPSIPDDSEDEDRSLTEPVSRPAILPTIPDDPEDDDSIPRPAFQRPTTRPATPDDLSDNGSLGIQELTNRFNQVSLEIVDPDGDIENGEEIVEYNRVEELTEISLQFPAGKVGIVLEKNADGDTLVSMVKAYCELRDYVLKGDIVLSIDNLEARKAPLADVVAELKQSYLNTRIITFGRQTTAIPAAPSRRHGMSTSRAATNPRMRDASDLDIDNVEAVPSFSDANGAAAAEHAQAEQQQASSKLGCTKVGEPASKLSHLKCRTAENQKEGCVKKLKMWCRMMEMTPMVDNMDSTNLPKIVPFLVLRDPYLQTNSNGGPRGSLEINLAPKIKIVIMAGTEDRLSDAEAVMKTLVEINFTSNDQYEVVEVTTPEQFTKALNGENRGISTQRQEGTPRRDGINRGNTAAEMTPFTY